MNVFELYGSLGLKTSDFKKGLKEAQKDAENASNNIQGSFNNLNDSLNVLVDAMNHGIDNAVSGSFGSFSNAAGIGISVIENVILAIKKADNFITTVNDTVVKTTANIITSSFDFAKSIDENVMGVVDSARDVVVDAFGQMMNAGLDFFQSVMEEGIEFDAAMGQVSATMMKSKDEFDEITVSVGKFTGTLTEYAQKLGAETIFTSTQVGEAMNYITLSGREAQETAELLPHTLDLAAAGTMGLGAASEMVTQAVNALGLEEEDVTRLIDQMAMTSTKSGTTIAQLGDGILTIGATARDLKGGITELNAALGVLADNGVQASEGGNMLRRVLTRLTTGDSAATMLETLGVSAYDAQGNMKGLPDIFMELNQAMTGFTEQQRKSAITDIFGQYSLAGANALLNTTTERWQNLTSAIEDSEGAAAKVAEVQRSTLKGQIQLLDSAYSGVKTNLFSKIAGISKEFVETLSTGLSNVAQEIKDGNFEAAFSRLGSTAVHLIEEGVDTVLGNASTINEFIDGIVVFVDKVGIALFEGGSELLPQLLGHLLYFAQQIITNFSDFLSQEENIKTIEETVSHLFEQLETFFDNNHDSLYNIFSTLFDIATRIIGEVFVLERETVYSILWEKFTDIIDDLVDNLGSYLESDEAQTIVDNVISLIGSVAQKLTESAPVILPALLDFVLKIADKVVTGVADYIADEENVDKIRGTLNLLITKIRSFLERHSEDFYQIVSKLWDVGIGFVWQIWELRRKTVAKTLGRKLKEVLDDCFDGDNPFALGLPSIGYNIISGIIDGMNVDDPSIAGTIGLVADRMLALFKGALGIESPSKVMKREVGRYIALGIGEGMTEEMESVSKDMAEAIPKNFDISTDIIGEFNSARGAASRYDSVVVPINIERVYANSEQDAKQFARTLSVELRKQILRENAAVAYA